MFLSGYKAPFDVHCSLWFHYKVIEVAWYIFNYSYNKHLGLSKLSLHGQHVENLIVACFLIVLVKTKQFAIIVIP